jgi:hypothetical protein
MVDLAFLLITFLCLPRHCLNLNRWAWGCQIKSWWGECGY